MPSKEVRKNTVYAHIPYGLMKSHLEVIKALRINPEIAFSCESLDAVVPQELTAIAGILSANSLQATIHAPFLDLNPGAVDPLVWEATLHRFNQVFDVAEVIRPKIIVFHPGYDRWRYGDKKRKWLQSSLEMWGHLLTRAERTGSIITVENIFEEDPATLRNLFETVDSPRFRHCFDIGHFNLFTRVSMEEWFAEVGHYIAEVHIHDNNGLRDEHLPIGEGSIDFRKLFALVQRYAPQAAYTIEAHTRQALERSLKNLAEFL